MQKKEGEEDRFSFSIASFDFSSMFRSQDEHHHHHRHQNKLKQQKGIENSKKRRLNLSFLFQKRKPSDPQSMCTWIIAGVSFYHQKRDQAWSSSWSFYIVIIWCRHDFNDFHPSSRYFYFLPDPPCGVKENKRLMWIMSVDYSSFWEHSTWHTTKIHTIINRKR